MPPPLLHVQDLTVRFRASPRCVLNNVSFSLEPGESMGLLGESGAGKSTLAHALIGLRSVELERVNGSVRFRGIEITGASERELQQIRGAQISLIGQEPELSLNPVMSVGEQVGEVIRAHSGLARRVRHERARSVLAAVGLPSPQMYSAYPHQLSGGQRQRVVIAQALACNPALLIADEPTSALDNVVQSEILALLHELRDRLHLALVFITHNPALLSGFANRVAVMHAGQLVENGTFEEIYCNPRHAFTKALVQADRNLKLPTSNPARIQPTALLEVRNLSKSYLRGRWHASTSSHMVAALRDVHLKINPGATLALVGKSGSGKSTLARCLARLEEPDCGEILFQGRDLLKMPPRELAPVRRRIQLIFQHSAMAMNPRLSAAEVVEEPLLITTGASKRERRERALAMMERVGIPSHRATRLCTEFSGGQRQRLAIARALMLQPELLILDEGLVGLDLSTQAQVADMLVDLQISHGLSYLFISHDLQAAAHLADTIALMQDGRIVQSGSIAELFSHPREEIADLIRSIPQAGVPVNTVAFRRM